MTSCGIAVLGCTPDDEWTVHTYSVKTVPASGTFLDMLDRMQYIRGQIGIAVEHADQVVIEGLAPGGKGLAKIMLPGLWWLALERIRRQECPITVVPPTTLKLWTTGKGRASKEEMRAAVKTMWPQSNCRNSDEADALAAASMAAVIQDLPVPWVSRAVQGVQHLIEEEAA